MNTFLVVGGTSFLGSAFIRYVLNEAPFQGAIINLDLPISSGDEERVSDVADDRRYTYIKGDASLLPKIHSDKPFTHIIDFSAGQTDAILAFLQKHPGIKFHFPSTNEVYGSLTNGAAPFVETSDLNPSTSNAIEKAALEHATLTAVPHATISRVCNTYGPYQHPEKLIPRMTLNCIEKKTLPIFGDGKNRRAWIYVDDYARALYTVIEKGKPGEIYNITSQTEWENLELVYTLIDEIANIEGEDSQHFVDLISFVDDLPEHDDHYAMNPSKIEKELAFFPKWDFQHGIYKTIQWYLDEKAWVVSMRKKPLTTKA